MHIAVIPARGGSKRIPRKNIRPFCGKPIIAYSIEAALKSGFFSSVVVSTDDAEIADVAKKYGADVPFMRPPALADDFTGTTPVVVHALNHYLEQGVQVDTVCCIYATTPFTTVSDLKLTYKALETAPASFTITTYDFPTHWALEQDSEGRMSMSQPQFIRVRSQDLPESYHGTGQIYWGTREFLLNGNDFQEGKAVGVQVPRHRVQDIDTEEDWVRAEAMYRALKETEQL
ncbi:pseudaminic acid cytidylyltransferase [Halodesulfovibrio spirochaetisodalis]|uniref:NeuA n=1 Tax=Halodesulfovibrio spirochaetisodalis TaxID=1560234 RepID=A0A1B7XAL2_9BACT|nr:pseudaminic acid cytidylyltransferase [Halodesulfovibrio spirochaetisodalis]OBQ46395.1 NeuA [Halodesulfovibrio spirochaetisodalis]